MDLFLHADTWLALLTLCFLEVVLGIDNIIFISIVSNKLPEELRKKARNTGLAFAMIVRVVLLLGITWIIGLKMEIFSVFGHGFSGRDLILCAGGLFLIAKSTLEINHEMEGDDDDEAESSVTKGVPIGLSSTIIQIILLDIVFSFDSILTAIGLSNEVMIMISAVIISMIVMMVFSQSVATYIDRHPSLKMLALSFLLMIGVLLVSEIGRAHV